MRVFRNTRAIDLLKKQVSKVAYFLHGCCFSGFRLKRKIPVGVCCVLQLFTMENEEQDVDFQSSLEPDVIITDGSVSGWISLCFIAHFVSFRVMVMAVSLV